VSRFDDALVEKSHTRMDLPATDVIKIKGHSALHENVEVEKPQKNLIAY
jgi:hypothetical protein